MNKVKVLKFAAIASLILLVLDIYSIIKIYSDIDPLGPNIIFLLNIICSFCLYLGFFFIGKLKKNIFLIVASCLMLIDTLITRSIFFYYNPILSTDIFHRTIILTILRGVPFALLGISLITLKDNSWRILGILTIILSIINQPILIVYLLNSTAMMIIPILGLSIYIFQAILFFEEVKGQKNKK
jgi:hypothetical protein